CDARTRRLNFQGSHIGFLAGDSLIVQGGVSLSEGFQAAGRVTLVAATIHGELVCSGGSFLKQDEQNRYALNVDGVKVGGRVLFTNGFLAVGGVSLFGAMIADNCECQGGYFFNPDGVALYASKAKIGGNVFLRNGFRAAGEVRLHGATITGNLECQGGCFFNPGRTALLADGVKVGGRAFFWKSVEYDGDQRRARGGFLAWGEVSLVGAVIFSDL